ncbi:MAG: DMT family transporter [Bdellovibrionales bacterium]|nr:DMT family transporter [Ramlibacter sp.]
MQGTFFALAAIALWATLASLAVTLRHVPPFLLTGIALLIGSLPAWPFWRQWKISPATLALGIYGLFGFHFLLFLALRMAPPVEANLINYLWPLLIVVLAPAFVPGVKLRLAHVFAAMLGFGGAAFAILGAGTFAAGGSWNWGYVLAFASAFIWASFSLMTKRLASQGRSFPTAAIGLFGLVSGLLALTCHWLVEVPVQLSFQDWGLLTLVGLGPLGTAFFLWDRALKQGDARHIGILSYLTPLASTVLLMMVSGRLFTWDIAVAAAMIISAAVLGTRAR